MILRCLVPTVALVCCIAFPLSADFPQQAMISAGGTFATCCWRAAGPVITTDLDNLVRVSVFISDVTDLYDFQFDLSFDPTILQLEDVGEGIFLKYGGGLNSTIFFPGIIDNTAGTVRFVGGSVLGPVSGSSGPSGQGLLAVLTFKAPLALGTSPLDFSGVILQDSSLTDIQFTTRNGEVRVTNVPLPEPVECAWMAPLLVLLWLWHKERACRISPQ